MKDPLFELFLKHALTDKEKVFLSEPMNTRHQERFNTFKIAYALGESK